MVEALLESNVACVVGFNLPAIALVELDVSEDAGEPGRHRVFAHGIVVWKDKQLCSDDVLALRLFFMFVFLE